ncbi:putative ABC transport system permease protein [[Eubacterium] yurii]|jgi:hypothetical protein|nr:putative ABC transport system permease protein [[Eubacterium] yurii]
MFFKLVGANSRRNKKDNALYFSSMLISVIAFYIILSVSNQDVMIFLSKMESDAVQRLLSIIPVLYITTLIILFVLVYFSSSIKMDNRKHELGMYMTLGVKKRKLFLMLYLEDMRNDLLALAIGLPVAIMLSELISLVTSKVIGMGIIGHRFSLSFSAILFTVIGFLTVKSLATVIITIKTLRKEIGDLLNYKPIAVKKQHSKFVYIFSLLIGLIMLAKAYYYGITKWAWEDFAQMMITVALGTAGTVLIFYGMRLILEFFIKMRTSKRLHSFNFRQIQEIVINRSTIIALCSLLIFVSLSLFSVGVATYVGTTKDTPHIMDYTFINYSENKVFNKESVRAELKENNLNSYFTDLFDIRLGQTGEEAFLFKELIFALEKEEKSREIEILLSNFKGRESCHLISLSGYNKIRKLANLPPEKLGNDEANLYIGAGFLLDKNVINKILKSNPKVKVADKNLKLVGDVQYLPIVTDRAITLSYAIVVNDEVFDSLTKGNDFNYVNGVLDVKKVKEQGLMRVIMDINQELDKTSLKYESYIQNIGRQLIHIISASYITIYLSIVFLVVANTIIGVLFLMSQRTSYKRYQTLVYLGATYDVICKSSQKQINNFFGLAIFVAVINSFFGVLSLFKATLPSSVREDIGRLIIISLLPLTLLILFEFIYIHVVKKSGNSFLMTLMEPKREE